jgi:predicted DCC family thiol-disulfide oxidoreductase YuxK
MNGLPVLFFDGVCNLCNGFVDFLVARQARLKIASLQGATSHAAGLHEPPFDSLVLQLPNGKVLKRSSAAIEAMAQIGGLWAIVRVLKLVPSILRDFIYNWVARNRYRIWGQKDTCRLPLPEERNYFLP